MKLGLETNHFQIRRRGHRRDIAYIGGKDNIG
jgi:hypothetical protein